MASRRANSDGSEKKPQRPPATTPEARENQLTSLAVDLAERQLLDGSASSQVITHYLKIASPSEKLMRENLELKNRLAEAQVENLQATKRIEEKYDAAIRAMRRYGGRAPEPASEENDEH